MSKELVVSATRHETRIAILEDDTVVEIFYQREKEYSLAGSIHKGKVTRVLPGMQSAFVDIGLERDAFLYVSDFFEDNEEYDKVVSSVEDKVLKLEKTAPVELPAPVVDTGEIVAVPENGEAPELIASEPVVLENKLEPRPSDSRPQESGRDRDMRGDGRRGRGRRGRRRRGGSGGGGLPESKFYSPRRGEADVDTAAAVERPEPVEEEEGEFPVLPGESLAKYSGVENGEAEVESESWEPEGAPEPEPELVSPVEPPPLPRMAETPAHPEPEVVEEVAAAEPMATEPASPAAAEALAPEAPVYAEPSPIPVVVEIPLPPELPESVTETETEEIGVPVRVSAEVAREIAEITIVPEPEAETAGEPEEGESAELSSEEAAAEEPVIEEDEGPEPARIPTSLTAALREQGNRFPHRLSRRARRKMRGSGPQGEHRGQPAAAPAVAPAVNPENADVTGETSAPVVTMPAPEPRPQRGRDRDRERERSDRPERPPRAERIERGDRGERGERPERGERSERGDRAERSERTPSPSISELLREGQEIIVQIAKEPLGQKGARITSHIALPGRFLVYMPTVDHVGVSRKIPSDEERQRLKRILQTNRVGMTGGFIVRTAGEGKSEEELRADMHFLYNLWIDIRQKAEKKPAPLLLHHDLDLVQRILRDQLTSSFKTIWVDNEEAFEGVLRFVQRFQPALVNRVKLYTRNNPIFDEFNITAELEKALRPKVWLKSGGYIVINQTEALVAIDVNTGKYVGKSNRLEDTIVRVNTDAIKEIVRQIRLRDLGGIIVVDFIDMDERKNRQKVMQALEESMRADRAPYKILAFNDFGLVAITRKRVKQSLERTLCSPCPSCEGAGYIKSVQTVVGEILQEAQKMAKSLEGEDVLLRVNPEVAKVLKSNRNDFLQEIEEILGRTVMVKSDPTLHQTKFDLA
ncbi:MAG TPA: Rne/Rng family ribonuclease [Bryobacteraceae bacterium]|jgi:ribonuclease G